MEKSIFDRRTNGLNLLTKKYGSISIIEEADFGAGCKKQIAKIRKVTKNDSKVIATTGTNADDKVKPIFSKNEPVSYYFRGYLTHVLTDTWRSKTAVGIAWHILNNNHMVKELGLPSVEMENFSDMFDIVNGRLVGEDYFRQVIEWLFIKRYTITFNREFEKKRKFMIDKEAATMIFTSGKKQAHELLKKIIEDIFGKDNCIVQILNGDETTNADAQQLAEKTIANANGRKVFFIASVMANRSFSVKEIKNIILFTNGGSYASIYQKIARGFTPWNKEHQTCNIIDFRLNHECCADTYIMEEAIQSFDENRQIKEDILDFVGSSDKLIFYEYFSSEKDPFRKLDISDVEIMIEKRDFLVKKVTTCFNDFRYLVNDPREGFNIFDEKVNMKTIFGQSYDNIKGDAPKKIISKTDKYDNDSKKKNETDRKARHIAWLIENFLLFDTDSFDNEKSWLYKEINENMPKDRQNLYEENYNIDMETIKSMVNILHENKIYLN